MPKFDMGARRLSARALRSYAAAAVPKMFATRAATESGGTEILLYDEIGWYGITAKAFVSALATIGDGPLTVRICSPGGDAFEGMAIYNALRYRAEPVSIVIDGIAASAASIVAMAGSISMREQSELMIHNCWGFCVGNRHDMLETAAIQERLDGQMAQIYAEKSGASAAVMAAAMDAETYYTAQEAMAIGLCDTVMKPPERDLTQAALRMLSYAPAPRALAARVRSVKAALPPYDPDGDGDNDAEAALGLIGSAALLLEEAMEALTGTDEDDDTAGIVVPGAKLEPKQPEPKAEPAPDPADIEAKQRRLRLAMAENAA